MAAKTYSVPAGTYTVAVSKTGYVTQSQTVTITNSDKTVNINLLALGQLSIKAKTGQTMPSGTKFTVKLNGATLGTGNYDWTSASRVFNESGTYEITVNAPGYRTFTQTISVADGEVKECIVDLEGLRYTLTVNATPSDATVTVKDSNGTTISAN